MHPSTSPLLAFTLLIVAAFPAHVVATPAPEAGALSRQLERSARLEPADISYQWHRDTLQISGRIDKRMTYYGRIPGHVDIDLLGDDGRVLRRHSSALETFSPNKRNPRSASFHAEVQDVPAGVVRLRITPATGAWH